jgi:acetyl esterase
MIPFWVPTRGSELAQGDFLTRCLVPLFPSGFGGGDRPQELLVSADNDLVTDSYLEFAEGPFLTRNAMKWFWSHYAPDIARRTEPTASPLRASLDQLQGLPPALILTAEFDVLCDEGEAYAHRLSRAGVSVTAVRYLGTIHAFTVLNALAETPAARAAISQANRVLRETFKR